MTANMRKAFLAFLPLIVLLTLSGCNTGGDTEKSDFTVSAADTAPVEAAGETDYAPKEDFDYTVSGGSVRIKKYIGNASVVVIPEKIEGYNITGIDAHFLEGSRVEEITYPSGITDFRGLSRCDNLKTLHLPASIEKMQDSLRFCENLTEIDIEEGGTYKTVDGVLYTSDMKTLVSYPRGRTGSFIVPDGVESIGIYAFCSSKLSEIVLPDSLKTIEAYAFMNAERLNEAIIPFSVKKIGFSAFSESGIKKLTLSEGVEEIMGSAFFETQIEELYVPSSVKSIGIDAFAKSGIKKLTLSEGVEEIMGYAFSETQIEELYVPSSVKSIGVNAFAKSGIKKITLSEGVEEIMSCAFSETRIEELYIPDSVQRCGSGIVDESVYISAYYPIEGLKALTLYKNADFRDETRLEEAFRKAEGLIERIENAFSYCQLIITDITGDNFPEIVRLYGIDGIGIYFFTEKREWQALNISSIDSGYRRGDLAFYLLHDKETDTYSYYSGVYEYTVWGSISSSYVPGQCKLSFTEDGMKCDELFDDDIKALSSEEIIETIDISAIIDNIVSEYDLDLEDEYKKFTLITDSFAEEPDGKIWNKSLNINGKSIEDFPYFESAYPEEMKLTVAGKDILHGEELEGVCFKHGMLTLNNAVIDAGSEEYIIEAANMSLYIELIGENRIVSEKPCSLLNVGDTIVYFKGDGSLEAPHIKARRIILEGGVRLRENKELVSGKQGLDVSYLDLAENSSLEYEQIAAGDIHLGGNSYLKVKSLICDRITLGGSGTAEIVNDISGVSGFEACAIHGVKTITIRDNARLYADNSLQNYDTLLFYGNKPELSVCDSGRLEIKGSRQGAGIAMFQSDYGTVEVYGEGSVVINSSKTCIEAPRVEISGGSMELNSCEDGAVLKVRDNANVTDDYSAGYYEGFESGYYINGEILSESPDQWEMKTANGNSVMYLGEKTVTSYSVCVKEKEYDEANGLYY